MASLDFKHRLVKIIGDKIAFYRIFFNFFSTVLFFAILFVIPKSETIVYEAPYPYDLFIFAIQVLAFIGLVWTAKSFDGLEFIGVKQVIRYFKGTYKIEDLDESPDFRISGAFKCCRHPAYFFSILFLGARPYMDLSYLVLFIAGTIYFVVGAYFEEKKLVKIYGDVYLQYKKSVPMFLPAFLFGKKVNR
jgi:protein-S-isoprenylcysteine O-methyltransferase Ste14